jgi:ketosteroid isomerase-like protein
MLDRKNLVMLLGLAAAAAVLAPVACAQKPKIEEAQAIELETRFEQALVSHDADALRSLLADDAIVIYATGEVLTRAQLISRLSLGGDETRWFQNFNSERRVTLTEGGAIVVGQGEEMLGPMMCLSTGGPSMCTGEHFAVYLSTTWAHTPRGWQIVFLQGTLQEAPSPKPVRSDFISLKPAPMANPVDAKITAPEALDLQKRFEAAELARDANAVAALIAEDATFVHWNAVAQTKDEFIAALGKDQGNLEGPNRKVVLFDDGASALVIGPVTVTVDEPLQMALNGKSQTVIGKRQLHIYLSTLWVHTDAGWQVLFSQGT